MSIELEGTFGRVYRGSYHEEGATAPRDVLVKTAAEHASQSQVSNLLLYLVKNISMVIFFRKISINIQVIIKTVLKCFLLRFVLKF